MTTHTNFQIGDEIIITGLSSHDHDEEDYDVCPYSMSTPGSIGTIIDIELEEDYGEEDYGENGYHDTSEEYRIAFTSLTSGYSVDSSSTYWIDVRWMALVKG